MGEETPVIEIQNKSFIPHYHGDMVRILFVIAAGLMFLAELLDAKLPFSSGFMVLSVILLVLAAGITNPGQLWIHWANLFLSLVGLMLFGGTALTRFKMDAAFRESFLPACLAAVFLVALYLATRTLRGLLMHSKTIHEQEPSV